MSTSPNSSSQRASMLVFRSALIAALGGLLFGYDTAVISGAVKSLREVFILDDWLLGFTVASALIGTILGAATSQIPANYFGRKPTLIVLAILYLISSIGCACPWNWAAGTLGTHDWYFFLISRFLGGFAVGASSVVSPLYTAEISPAKSRGFLVALTQFNLVFGILLAFFMNYLIGNYLASWIPSVGGVATAGMEWRWMLGVMAIPSALFFIFAFTIPESPRWLIGQGKTEKARSIIEKLGTDENCSVDEEVHTIQSAIEEEKRNGKTAFFTKRLWFPIMLAICIAAFNQLSGINAVLYYAPSVFSMAGVSKELGLFLPVVIGFVNLIFTMAAMAIIDNFGRKKLMIAGSLGYIISLAVVGGTFVMYASEFNVSMKNFAAQDAQAKFAERQVTLDALREQENFNQETDKFNEEELKKALIECVMAVDEAIAVQGKDVGKPLSEETTSGMSIEALKSEIHTKTTNIDLKPVVPLTGVIIVLVGIAAFIASHAFGQGACIWVFLSEIFPQEVRAQGTALGCLTHWVFAALVTQFFPPLLGMLGPSNIFFMFSGFMVLQLIWVLTLMPETKQVPLEEMKRRLGIK